MSERRRPTPENAGLTEQEQLFSRVNDKRLRTLIQQPETIIQEAKVSSNNYGEFLFITLGLTSGGKQDWYTFYGLGLHEPRDRYLLDEWHFFPAMAPRDASQPLSQAEVLQFMDERQAEVRGWAQAHTGQSREGQLFELIAELTDDDGALAEFEDFGGLWHALLGDDEDAHERQED